MKIASFYNKRADLHQAPRGVFYAPSPAFLPSTSTATPDDTMIIICSPHRRHADARAHQLALCRLETSKKSPKERAEGTE